MAEKNLLYEVIKAFARINLSPDRVDNTQMGYVFEELIRIGAEQSNEEAGEHFTPREVIKLMVNLLLSPEKDLARSHVVKTIYDPACGTGGMLSVSEKYIRDERRHRPDEEADRRAEHKAGDYDEKGGGLNAGNRRKRNAPEGGNRGEERDEGNLLRGKTPPLEAVESPA